MKGKLFLRVGLLLFAAVLLGSAVTYAAVQPQLAGTEARAQALSHLSVSYTHLTLPTICSV